MATPVSTGADGHSLGERARDNQQRGIFYDDASAGVDAIAPYSGSVASPPVGAHTVYARATDSLGRTTFTATNTVTLANDPLANDNFVNRFMLGTPAHETGANAGAGTESGEPTSTGDFSAHPGARLYGGSGRPR